MLPIAIHVFSRHMFLACAFAGIIVGVYGFTLGFRRLQRKRLILNTPASKIRSAAMGLVEISGLATGPHVVVSPLQQAECYYYRTIVWELKARASGEWTQVADESLHVPFYLDDSTDKVLVDPASAEMDLRCDFQEEFEGVAPPDGDTRPAAITAFLARHQITSTGRIKIEEYCIKPENFLFVLGTLSQNPGLDVSVMPSWAMRAGQSTVSKVTEVPPQAEGLQEVIRLSAGAAPVPVAQMTQQQKIAAALAKSGAITSMPWSSAESKILALPDRVPQPVVVPQRRAPFNSTGFDLHPAVVLMKGATEPTFFISWRSQRDVVSSLNWKSALLLWGSPALVAACMYALIVHAR